MNDRGHSRNSRTIRNPPKRGGAATRFLWLGPGELVVLDVLRTGRIGTAAVLLTLAVALAALPPATAVTLGLRAGIDALSRLLFLPSHPWSAAVLLVDVVLIAAAWHTAGRAGRGTEKR